MKNMNVKARAKAGVILPTPFLQVGFDAIIKFLKICCAALCAFTAMSSHASFLSDVWWVPEESGWGASVTQQGDASFITLFVYGSNGEPIWYVAGTRTAFPTEPVGMPLTFGPLYRMRGPWFGDVFDPKSVQATLVGSLSVEPINSKDAIFRYNVDGTTVTKTATRFTAGVLSGFSTPISYVGSMHLVSRVSVSDASGTFTFGIESGRATLVFRRDNGGGECTYAGPIAQFGKFTNIKGTFQCSPGDGGEVEISEMELNRNGFTAQMSLTLNIANVPISLKGTIAGARR
jgi:hypothetical protein